jgi:hypothetical protein
MVPSKPRGKMTPEFTAAKRQCSGLLTTPPRFHPVPDPVLVTPEGSRDWGDNWGPIFSLSAVEHEVILEGKDDVDWIDIGEDDLGGMSNEDVEKHLSLDMQFLGTMDKYFLDI